MRPMTLTEFSQAVATQMCGVVDAALVIAIDYMPDGQMEMLSSFRGRPDITEAQHVQVHAFFTAVQAAIKANMHLLDPTGTAKVTADYMSEPPAPGVKA